MSTVEMAFSEVSLLFKNHPDLNINWPHFKSQWTALHAASVYNTPKSSNCFWHILAFNAFGDDQFTPLLLACMNGCLAVVQLLLKDPRVDVTLADSDGRTPLWFAASQGRQLMVEWLIASGSLQVAGTLEMSRSRGTHRS